jgi:hypothetical protein
MSHGAPATWAISSRWTACVLVIRTLPPEPITGGGDPRSMVPVRLAGAEVTEAFWAKLAGLY